MRRKGGMELSINAIVILIIAMVVLGIGILFIRGMFAKAQVTTFKALTSQETTNPASAERPFIADRELVLSSNKPTATLSLSIYNSQTTDVTDLNITMTGCKDNKGDPVNIAGETSPVIGFTSVDNGQVPSNNFVGYQTAITLLNKTHFSAGDSAVCTLRANSTQWSSPLSTSVILKIQATS